MIIKKDYISFSVSKNKTLEAQIFIDKQMSKWFHFSMSWSRKGDHAGLNLEFGILGVFFYWSICDNRHWNWDANRWYVGKEESKKQKNVKYNDFRGAL